MKFRIIAIVIIVALSGRLFGQPDTEDDKLSSFTIDSDILSESISVTTYNAISTDKVSNIVYITDGQKMIDNGALDTIRTLTQDGKIPKAKYVFVSTIDVRTKEDKRNTYFFCNTDYIRFFEEELVPLIEGSPRLNSKYRSLIGISFGGLNASYFSGRTNLFQNYALLSPITYPCNDALTAIAFSENKNLNILISTGKNDAENYVTPLTNLYQSKGYTVKNVTTNGAHDFENWNHQLEDVLNFLIQKK
ncbi:alpha/beta hydrolase-fold protein [Winogradskyella maritima]|uniref:Alpha/beta hydrolase n=1 Tax=Winogradskyella maritima TaxID=1517766 RepID=A0ABV8AFU6_9FLAO|nr:alpha/beta hydrolase-fold protein [Winogradskyella maritima]